jgi:hypothetical protein
MWKQLEPLGAYVPFAPVSSAGRGKGTGTAEVLSDPKVTQKGVTSMEEMAQKLRAHLWITWNGQDV